MAPMWSVLGRRALGLLVGFFALLGFVAVPLGKRTGYEHAKAIIATAPMADAAGELIEAVSGLRDRVLPPGGPAGPSAPSPSGQPSPVPPPMAHAATPDAGADASLPSRR
jgi:hypothetical protein